MNIFEEQYISKDIYYKSFSSGAVDISAKNMGRGAQ